jgi:SDR family mycofactocin-dependent oxidoreductase
VEGLEGRVAFITGAARGQGRSHAVELARRGVDIIAVDICRQIASVPYPMGKHEDLAQTVAMVEAVDRQAVAVEADVRSLAELQAAYERGVARLGAASIVIANAGICSPIPSERPDQWQDIVDVNLTGAYHTVKVAEQSLISAGAGGSVILIGSTAALSAPRQVGADAGSLAYTAAKHGLIGLMRAYSNYFAPYNIRVNSVHPTGVDTPMVTNSDIQDFFRSRPEMVAEFPNALPVRLIGSIDVSSAVVWLCSDQARYVTGVALPVDAGFTNGHGRALVLHSDLQG